MYNLLTVEGKNLAPLYSHVDFPRTAPSPPALILLCVVAQGPPRKKTKTNVVIVSQPRSNIKAGGPGAGWESQHANKAVQGFFLPQ